jgi:hypothetical protein
VLYDPDGDVPTTNTTPAAPGFRHSRPILGRQRRLFTCPARAVRRLFGTVADLVSGGHVLDVQSGRELANLADLCADSWRHENAGIGELQQYRQHTSSKMNSWRALDAADRLRLGRGRSADRHGGPLAR